MARSIQTLLDQILTAVYGEQVRTAIHDSIETCYDDVEASSTLANEAAVNATNSYQTVNAILGDVSSYIQSDVTVANSIAAAQTAASNAITATANVQTAINSASTATIAANSAATNANTKATLAESKASLADSKATLANTAAEGAREIIARWNGTDGSTGILASINAAINTANDAADTASVAASDANDATDAAEAATESIQAIIARWNGTDGSTGISDAIQDAISAVNDATEDAQDIINIWNGDGALSGLSTDIATAINNAVEAASDLEDLKEDVETAAENAETAASDANIAARQAASDAADARLAKTACDGAAALAGTATTQANTARDNANSAASLLQNLEVLSQQVSSDMPSSAVVELISNVQNPHYRITFQLSKGVKGDSMIIKGQSYDTLADLQVAVPASIAQIGDMYNVGTELPYDVYRWTGSYWENQGPIGFSIENLTDTDIDQLWAGSYQAGGSSKYIDDAGLLYLLGEKLITALAGKVNVDGNKVLSTNDFTDAYVALLAPATATGSIQAMIASLDSSKVDKDGTKVLSTNDFTDLDLQRVNTIPNKVDKADIESSLNTESNNPVRNSTIATAINTLTAATPLTINLAPAYDNSISYEIGAYRTYNRLLYRCSTRIINAEEFNPSHWTQINVSSELNTTNNNIGSVSSSVTTLASRVTTNEGNISTLQTGLGTVNTNIGTLQTNLETLTENFAPAYSTTKVYKAGEYCIYNGIFYKCNTDFSASQQTFRPAYWDASTVDKIIDDVDFTAIEDEISDLDSSVTSLSSSVGSLESSVTSLSSRVSVLETDVLVVNIPSFSSLPQTVTNSAITENHILLSSELGTKSAQMGDWTVTTSNGSVTVSGVITEGLTTTLKLVLAKTGTIVN